MRHADIAMYQAKTSRDRYDFYAHERDTHSLERLALAAELAAALASDAIEVHYQPKADARTRRIVGVEALARWRRADGAAWRRRRSSSGPPSTPACRAS